MFQSLLKRYPLRPVKKIAGSFIHLNCKQCYLTLTSSEQDGWFIYTPQLNTIRDASTELNYPIGHNHNSNVNKL